MSSTKSQREPKAKRKKVKSKLPNDVYEAELFRLQTEFVKLHTQ